MKMELNTEDHLLLIEIENTTDIVTISKKARWMQLAKKTINTLPSLLKKAHLRKKTCIKDQKAEVWTSTYDHLKVNAHLT